MNASENKTPHRSLSQCSYDSGFLKALLGLPRYGKRAILMFLDFALMSFALWAAYSLRLGVFYWPEGASLWLLLICAPIIGVLLFHYNGLYKLVTRFYGSQGALKVVMSVGIAVLIWCLLIYMSQFTLSAVPRSVIVMFGLFSILFIWGARSFLSYFLRSLLPYGASKADETSIRVLIYGVGEVGTQLAQELAHSPKYCLVGFIDEDPSLWRQMLLGVRVYSPNNIISLIQARSVKEVFLADPNLPRRKKQALLNELTSISVQLKTLSSLHELASDKALLSDLRKIGLDDLLGRAAVPPEQDLLDKTVLGKSVLITGAGGSIGSELVRQVASLEPLRLVLYERSELALYQIEHEIQQIRAGIIAKRKDGDSPAFELVSVLGCVQDKNLLAKVIRDNEINTLYHAAAYKHVPIVEENPFVGLQNNVFGTLTAAQAANENGVDLFVLISTDKAVRPTNIMGASKRLAELCLQAYADQESTSTMFTMVRFGNVLGSSGSVVARFQDQIENGGPVTVTHPEIVRYFMMIPEAAQLVIQAGGLATGGDVFVLDMGQPVKIVDLAKSMINLSGLEVADEENPEGDIFIEFIGLREGEKLYEELLISENSTATLHASIIRNHEDFLQLGDLNKQLGTLENAIETFDIDQIHALLFELVEGYQCRSPKKQPSTRHQNNLQYESGDKPSGGLPTTQQNA